MENACPKCGHKVDGSTPICMYCGACLPQEMLTSETQKKIVEEMAQPQETHSTASPIRAVGALLMIIGFAIDIATMFMIFSGDLEVFNALTIIGTIAFLLGIALFSNG